MEAVDVSGARPAPSVVGWPLIGSLFDMGHDPLEFITRLPREHGGIVSYRMGMVRHWLLTEPELIEEVLVARREQMHKDVITSGLSRLAGRGLLTSEDPAWRQQRKLAAPSFQPRHLAAYADAMVQAAKRGRERVTPGPRDVHVDMTEITLEIVLRTLFGADNSDGLRASQAIESFMGAFEREIRSVERLLPASIPTPGRLRIMRARRDLVEILDRVVAARRAQAEPGEDLLGRLLSAKDEDGRGMSDEQLRDELVTLFVAGHETTALALSYALWLIAGAPEIQDRLEEERKRVLGDRDPQGSDYPKLALHDAVIQEAMRLYPPAWMMGRTPTEPVTIAGCEILPGEQILMPQWAVHRSERFWSDPQRFSPDRFLGEGCEASKVPRFAYFPFGGGPRVCIGNHFARLEAALVLATWLSGRRIARAPSARLDLMPAVTLRPRGGVWLTVR